MIRKENSARTNFVTSIESSSPISRLKYSQSRSITAVQIMDKKALQFTSLKAFGR